MRWLCLDLSVVADIDFSGAETLREIRGELEDTRARRVFSMCWRRREELDQLGVTETVGSDADFETVADAIEAYPGPTRS